MWYRENPENDTNKMETMLAAEPEGLLKVDNT